MEGLSSKEQTFIRTVWDKGAKLYRDLPWRKTNDPYAVLVSEIMLQQTQVARVLKYWQRFMAHFPTLDALAAAETRVVLEHWQGLGYNRRALALKKTADICAARYQGLLPHSYDALLELPGIGKATAGGVVAFAYNEPVLYLETNVRAVYLHEFFPSEENVSDKTLEPLVLRTCSHSDPRGWYYALLDYGSHLKKATANPSRRSRHYSRQSTFEGSRRQKRAELVRVALSSNEVSFEEFYEALGAFEKAHKRPCPDPALVRDILDDLIKEGFLTAQGKEPGLIYRVS